MFAELGDLLIESPVNGRLISTFKLKEPIVFHQWTIELVELPAPKPGKQTVEGFEHIEVVVDTSFESLKEKFGHCRFDEGGLKKSFNQELEIDFGDKAIKFHHLSLESVIELEKNKNIYSALQNSKILENFKAHQPLVVGTFPLGLQDANSDIDILLNADDLGSLEKELMNFLGLSENFKIFRTVKQGLDSLVAQFEFQNVRFEIFAQKLETNQQQAFLHFQIEERLLRLGGSDFRAKVLNLRKQGLKTEPAFAQALSLSGDPYQALLNLQKKSDKELSAFLQQ